MLALTVTAVDTGTFYYDSEQGPPVYFVQGKYAMLESSVCLDDTRYTIHDTDIRPCVLFVHGTVAQADCGWCILLCTLYSIRESAHRRGSAVGMSMQEQASERGVLLVGRAGWERQG